MTIRTPENRIRILTEDAFSHIPFVMSTMKHIRTAVFGVSQKEFADITGVHQATVSRWDRGELFPEIEAMRKIREAAKQRSLTWSDALFFEVDGAQ